MARVLDWKLTQEEYLNTRAQWSAMGRAFRSSMPTTTSRRTLSLTLRARKALQSRYRRERWAHIYAHRAEIRWALLNGKSVPQRVLEDYPEVVREFAVRNPHSLMRPVRNPMTPRLTLQDIGTLGRLWWGPLAAGPFKPGESVALTKAQQARLPGLIQRGYVEKKYLPMSGMAYFITVLGRAAVRAADSEGRKR